MSTPLSTEEAMAQLLADPAAAQVPYLAYCERDVMSACRRFAASEEWQAMRSLLSRRGLMSGQALDLGAGNGIASYALASEGWSVTAVEPDPSELVGAGAIRAMVATTGFKIRCESACGESLPFQDRSFDLVYARQVLHHAENMDLMLREAARILRPGGWVVMCREHVTDDEESLVRFLKEHPLHRYTKSEHAYPLPSYVAAISRHLEVKAVLGPWDTVINYYPDSSIAVFKERFRRHLASRFDVAGAVLSHVPYLRRRYGRLLSAQDRTPGRRYTFLARKR